MKPLKGFGISSLRVPSWRKFCGNLPLMSGHSKWSSIKHKKAITDSKRGRVFTKLIKEITIAARLGGATLDEITYEGYGPAGVAIMVEVLSDNRNRTVAELRFIFSRRGGNLGETGCVGWMFKKRGVIGIEKSAIDEDKLLELALDAGADDVNADGDTFQVLTAPEHFTAVRDTLEKSGLAIAHSELTRIPENTVAVSGHAAGQVLKLMEELEDHDDVQNVASNFDISEEEMAQCAAA